MKYLLLLLVVFLPNIYAENIYKCVGSDGKIKYSYKPCKKGLSETKINSAIRSWEKEIRSNVDTGSEIKEISKDGEDVFIKYNFKSQQQLTSLMRKIHQLSGKNVSLLKMKAPINGRLGTSEIRVSSKENGLFPEKP